MSRFRQTPSPATVMSAIALFISLGGVGYAAASIGSAQIKNNAVASKDIKNGTIVTKDISKSTARSLKGATGATGARGATGAAGSVGPVGPAGAAGSALAFAHVNANGTLDTANSKNVTISPSGAIGVFCLKVTTAQAPQNVVATLDISGAGASTDQIRASRVPTIVAPNCASAPGSDTLVETTVGTTAGAGANRPFYVVFN